MLVIVCEEAHPQWPAITSGQDSTHCELCDRPYLWHQWIFFDVSSALAPDGPSE
jgi:hypothetical protein